MQLVVYTTDERKDETDYSQSLAVPNSPIRLENKLNKKFCTKHKYFSVPSAVLLFLFFLFNLKKISNNKKTKTETRITVASPRLLRAKNEQKSVSQKSASKQKRTKNTYSGLFMFAATFLFAAGVFAALNLLLERRRRRWDVREVRKRFLHLWSACKRTTDKDRRRTRRVLCRKVAFVHRRNDGRSVGRICL